MTELRKIVCTSSLPLLIAAVGKAGKALYCTVPVAGYFQRLYNGGVDVGFIGQLIEKCASRTVITIRDPCYARGFYRAIGEDSITNESLTSVPVVCSIKASMRL